MNVSDLLKRNDSLLTHAVRPAGIITTLLRRIRKTDQRTLIVRPGGLGDLVVASAVISDLGIESSRIHWLIERRSEPWARHIKISYSTYDDYRNILGLHLTTQFALVVVLEQLFGLAGEAGIALAANSRRVHGFTTNRTANRYGVACHYDPYDGHELEEFARLLGRVFSTSHVPVRYRTRAVPDHGYSVVAIAGTGSKSRRLSATEWATFAMRNTDGAIVVVTNRQDEDLAMQVVKLLDTRTELVVGEFDLVCDKIKHARRVVTIDGGMVHVASYYGVPVDAIFTAGREKKWGPWSRGSRVHLARGIPCRPCTVFGQVPQCPNQLICKDHDLWQAQDA